MAHLDDVAGAASRRVQSPPATLRTFGAAWELNVDRAGVVSNSGCERLLLNPELIRVNSSGDFRKAASCCGRPLRR